MLTCTIDGGMHGTRHNEGILYSMSTDGVNWTKTDGSNVIFPSLSTPDQASAMFVGPPIKINGRW